jgi:hypothetical protein
MRIRPENHKYSQFGFSIVELLVGGDDHIERRQSNGHNGCSGSYGDRLEGRQLRGILVPGEHHSGTRGRRGFVIGELLVALLLLAVAVSSLAALMYSVSRRPESSQDPVECVARNGKSPGNCVPRSTVSGASKLLRSGCAAKIGTTARGCNDSVSGRDFDSLGETIVRSRTDSASLALLAKKHEAARTQRRPDRGFIR